MSNKANKSGAMKLIDAYKHILAASVTPREINAADMMKVAAGTINTAHPKLFADADDLAATVAGELLHAVDLRGEAGLRAAQDFANVIVHDIFVAVEKRDPSSFAPGSRRLDLLVSALATVDADKPVTVSQIAARADIDTGAVRVAIGAGRLPATLMGKTYIINADDAAVFIASRRSEKPAE